MILRAEWTEITAAGDDRKRKCILKISLRKCCLDCGWLEMREEKRQESNISSDFLVYESQHHTLK